MKSDTNKRAIILGVFIFLGLIFFLAGVLAIGNLRNTFTKKVHVTAIFDDVSGLQAGNNVWFSGVKIGTVADLSFYGESQVKVVIKINEKSQQYIRKDAKVKISTDGLIGNKILIIYGGTSQSPPVEDGDALVIENITSTEEMVNTLQENNRNLLAITTDFKIISKKIVDGEGTVGKLLKDESLYNSLDVTLAALQKSSANAEKLTAAFSDYGAKLNQEGSLTNDLVTDTTIFNNIQASVQQLKQLTVTAAEATNNLKTASTNVSNATSNLNSKDTPIGVLLNDETSGSHVKVTLRNMETASQKLDEDLRAAQDNFLLRGYFKKQKKAEEKAAKEAAAREAAAKEAAIKQQ